jgi:hypothetical protein
LKNITGLIALPSASLRKQQLMHSSLISRNPTSTTSSSINCSRRDVLGDRVQRNCVQSKVNKGAVQIETNASSGDTLCCSSLNSSDIKNCNKLFWKKYEQEVAAKVWHGALDLGVELNKADGFFSKAHGAFGSTAEDCILEIQENEKRDEVGSFRREQQQFGLL